MNDEERAEELFPEMQPPQQEAPVNDSSSDKTDPDRARNLSGMMDFNFNEVLSEEAKPEPGQPENTEEAVDLDGNPLTLTPEQQKKQKRKSRRKKGVKIGKGILSWVKEIAIALLIVWFILTFVAQNNKVQGTSMQPNVMAGDNVIVNKFIYRFTDPARGDIVVFPEEEDGKTVYLIKRIIGLPGDVVDIRDGSVYINDILLEEDYIDVETSAIDGQVTFPMEVPEGEYFVLGDNRLVSKDSHYLSVGTVAKKDIVGKASLRIWPLKSIGILK